MKRPIVRFQENETVDSFEPYIQFAFYCDGNDVLRSEFNGVAFMDGYVSKETAIEEIKKLVNEIENEVDLK